MSRVLNFKMMHIAVYGLFVLCAFSMNAEAETRGPKWGDVSGPYLFQERVVKIRIPLFTRSTLFEYPLVCFVLRNKLHSIL